MSIVAVRQDRIPPPPRLSPQAGHGSDLPATCGAIDAAGGSRPAGRSVDPRATAAALTPLAIYRLVEWLVLSRFSGQPREVARHILPASAMWAVSALCWSIVAPLPRGRGGAHWPAERRAVAVAAGLLLGAVAALANLLTMLASGEPHSGEMLSIGTAAVVVHVALLAPIAEETAFRGLVHRHLRSALSAWPASAASSLIFAAMHSTLWQALWAGVLGMVLAFAYEQTRSLWAPILIHALFNAIPVGVAVVRAAPHDISPIWLVLALVAVVFSLAARSAARPASDRRPPS